MTEASPDLVTEVQQHPRYPVPQAARIVTVGGDVEELTLEDVSLGGAFVRTESPYPPGVALTLQFVVDATPLSLAAEVAHVVTPAMATVVGHAPGMGVRFQRMSAQDAELVRAFVDGAARAQLKNVADDAIDAMAGRVQNVAVNVAENVAVNVAENVDESVDDSKRADSAEAARSSERATRAAAAHGAVDDVVVAPPPRAPPLPRTPSRPAMGVAPPPQPPARPDPAIEAKVEALIGDADAAEAANDLVTTLRLLDAALALMPGNDDVRSRATLLRRERAPRHAAQLLDDAMRGRAPKAAAEMVREAVRLSTDRTVLARAVELLVTLGERDDAVRAAHYLVAHYPDDQTTLSFLLEAHVSAGRFADAMPYGEQLVRLNPSDVSLRERVQKVAQAARRR